MERSEGPTAGPQSHLSVETSCPDCGGQIGFEVVDGRPGDVHLVFHCLVPAPQWWDDIAFT